MFIGIGMLVHWPENQPVPFEEFHEVLQSPGHRGFDIFGDCVVFYKESIQHEEEGKSKWSDLSSPLLQLILCEA